MASAGDQDLAERDGRIAAVQPVIRGILRRKFRTSLDPGDRREDNQEALELYSEVLVKLLRAVDGRPLPDAEEFKKLSAVITYHTWSQYLREKYPRRASLKSRLHWFLTHRPGFALWEDAEGDTVCGLAGWKAQAVGPASPSRVASLRANPGQIDPAARPRKTLDRMGAAEWEALLDAVFPALEGVVEVDDLVDILGSLFGVKEECRVDLDDARQTAGARLRAREPLPDRQAEIGEMLARLWREIRSLKREWLLPFLLNPPGVRKDERGQLDVFPMHGIASAAEIGELLALTEEQYSSLWEEWGVAAPSGSGQHRFAALWNRLPLRDSAIARLMGVTQQQVINLRMVATNHLAKRLGAGNMAPGLAPCPVEGGPHV